MATIQGKQKTPQENLVGKTLCNDEYYIHRVIGHGGMGMVYLAAHTELTVPVALKQARADQPLPESVENELDTRLQGNGSPSTIPFLDAESSGGVHTDRFLREALFLARLHHPALPSLYDYFFEDGYWYMVMDYIPGPTLSMYLRQHGALPPLEALNYAIQLCDVFGYLHKQSPPIVYRDLKPSNILITPEGNLMLVDFGIARYFKEGQNNDTTDFGSPGYASPEQYTTEGQTDGRSDLYSLGVLLYEMLSGQRPTMPNGLNGITHVLDNRKDTPAISAVLGGLITLATRTEPMYRFQSAHTFFLALERAYTIEEQRTYSQRVMLEQAMERPGAPSPSEKDAPAKHQVNQGNNVPGSGEGAERQETPQINPLEPSQRQKTREVLQQMRNERREDAELETELATMDAELERRVSTELSQFSIPTIHDSSTKLEAAQPASPPRQALAFSVSRFIRISFVVALILCLLMASLLLATHVLHHPPLGSQGPSPVTIPAQTVTTNTPTSVPVAGTWQPLPSLPSTEADNAAAYVQVRGRAYVYVNGGYRGTKVSPHYDHHLYRYDVTAAQWQMSANAQFPAMVNNAVAIDATGRLFYTSGYSSISYSVTSLLYVYTPSSDTVQKIVPPSNVTLGFGNSIISDGHGHLYITQGFTHSGANQQAGTGWYRYDISTNTWHILAPLPVGLGYVTLAQRNSTSIVLIGGATDAGQYAQTNTIYTYATSSNTWQQSATHAPYALSGTASCAVGPGQLVVIGGFDETQDKGTAKAWLINTSTLQWTPLTPLPTGGSVLGTAACDGQGHVFLVRGASDPTVPTADFWELTVP